NGPIGVQGNGNQNQIGNGNVVAVRAEGNAAGHNGNQIRCYNCRGVGHFARDCITDKAPVYDSDGSAEVHEYENCYNDEIFNMFTQEEQYTELLEPIPEPQQVPQNDNNVISEVTNVEQGGETVEQHSANFEETRALYDSLYHNLAIKVEKIESRIQSAHDGQKSYADARSKPSGFQVGNKDLLKVSPWKGVIRFGKEWKLSPRYIVPFKVLAKVGTIACRFKLPQQLRRVRSTFHVSNLKKCLSDESLVISLDEIHIDDKLHFIEEPVEIMDRKVKQLKQCRIPIIKVR
nr:putative reverse transcriptase domain-containing protein [Tanacetum cinerariifolium]